VVRLPIAVWPLLGIEAGDQVILNWAGRQIIATALELFEIRTVEADERKLQAVDLHRNPLIENIPEYLKMRVSATVRGDLGLPRYSVVSVRRRLSTIVTRRLNELIIPMGVLVLTGLLIPGLQSWVLVSGSILIIIFSFWPIRYQSPPKGRWP
jgi:hypothetical protein